MRVRDIIEAVSNDELKKALKGGPKASPQSEKTKKEIQAYKDKRYGTKAEQKAKAAKQPKQDPTLNAKPWQSGSSVEGGSLD